MMIHLGKQRDKATRSPTMVMPIGDTLQPHVPQGPGHGAEIECNYTLKSDQTPV